MLIAVPLSPGAYLYIYIGEDKGSVPKKTSLFDLLRWFADKHETAVLTSPLTGLSHFHKLWD